MQVDNALVLSVSLNTGMRVSDVLHLELSHLLDRHISYVAEKTGKYALVECPENLLRLLRTRAKRYGVCFPSRAGSKTPYRSRQAVWADVRKAAALVGIRPHVSPHSARKTFAVELFHREGMPAVQEALQHRYKATTAAYALSDVEGVTYRTDKIVDEVYKKTLARLSDLIGQRLTP